VIHQGFLTGILRIQTGRQQIMDAAAFRRRMKEGLREAEREAVKRGYRAEEITEASFAIVAFLDEAILTSSDPCRAQWAEQSLQEELFGVATAGQQFFERLEKVRSRHDSPQLADLLEVYYLCLLLGYEGRYAVGPKAELVLIMDQVRDRIEQIRGRREVLSPQGQLPPESAPAAPSADLVAQKLRLGAAVSLLVAVLAFLFSSVHLWWRGDALRTELIQLIQRSRTW